MSNTKPRSAVEARKLARDNMAAKLKAQQERDRANEADLVTFFELDAAITKASDTREAARAKADADYAKTRDEAAAGQTAALTQMRGRGLSERELIELTGLSAAELRRLSKKADAPRSAEVKSVKEKKSPSSTVNDAISGGDSAAVAS